MFVLQNIKLKIHCSNNSIERFSSHNTNYNDKKNNKNKFPEKVLIKENLCQGWPTQTALWAAFAKNHQKYKLFAPFYDKNLRK
jgi:hypothetical protein